MSLKTVRFSSMSSSFIVRKLKSLHACTFLLPQINSPLAVSIAYIDPAFHSFHKFSFIVISSNSCHTFITTATLLHSFIANVYNNNGNDDDNDDDGDSNDDHLKQFIIDNYELKMFRKQIKNNNKNNVTGGHIVHKLDYHCVWLTGLLTGGGVVMLIFFLVFV